MRFSIIGFITLAAAGCSDHSNTETPDAAIAATDATVTKSPDARMQAEVTTITNSDFQSCEARNYIAPALPSEAGHRVATRLTPSEYPFQVKDIGYDLYGALSAGCNATLEHRVELYISTADAPVASPTVVQTINVPAFTGDVADDLREVALSLESPIVLTEGQSLYVSVEHAAGALVDGAPTEAICSVVCKDNEGKVGRYYWSNAATAPYNWADTVAVFGLNSNYTYWASGVAQ